MILSLALTGLVVGALARFAVPGPDPMPIWMTILFGIGGAFLGGGIGYGGGGGVGALVGVVAVAAVLRRGCLPFGERRPMTWPAAKRRPRRRV